MRKKQQSWAFYSPSVCCAQQHLSLKIPQWTRAKRNFYWFPVKLGLSCARQSKHRINKTGTELHTHFVTVAIHNPIRSRGRAAPQSPHFQFNDASVMRVSLSRWPDAEAHAVFGLVATLSAAVRHFSYRKPKEVPVVVHSEAEVDHRLQKQASGTRAACAAWASLVKQCHAKLKQATSDSCFRSRGTRRPRQVKGSASKTGRLVHCRRDTLRKMEVLGKCVQLVHLLNRALFFRLPAVTTTVVNHLSRPVRL